ncbi:MAG: hypothetical protein HY585_02700 [Candidatus Omnitrophica bacterium]|nr:hypothetical protein [Candidatus Omnitrophota bacterium]
MKEKMLVGIIACLILSFALPIIALAVNDTSLPQPDEPILDPFSEADALRYGGLFGPLVIPESGEALNLETQNQQFQGWGGVGSGMGINARDAGFGSDEGHFIPISKARVSSGS